jgi:hypothetical protein
LKLPLILRIQHGSLHDDDDDEENFKSSLLEELSKTQIEKEGFECDLSCWVI